MKITAKLLIQIILRNYLNKAIRLKRIDPWSGAEQLFLGLHRVSGAWWNACGEICSEDLTTHIDVSLCHSDSIDSDRCWVELGIYVRIARIIQGLAQGLIYPSVHSMLARWVHPSERGFLATFTYSGTHLGTESMLWTILIVLTLWTKLRLLDIADGDSNLHERYLY